MNSELITLYHGTTERALDAIKREGWLYPGAAVGRDNWPEQPAHPQMVYLTNAYAIHYACAACEPDDVPVVIEVEVETDCLFPDEDFLSQAAGDTNRISEFRNALHLYQQYAFNSLEKLGTVAHHGGVPVDQFRRVAILRNSRDLWCYFDPTVTLLNYQYMGAYYRESMQWLFDNRPLVSPFGRDVPAWKPGDVELAA